MTRQSSTSSSFDYQWTYDVFINFRGEDTRHGFTGNLYNALSQKGIRTFFDDAELRKGDEITPSLLKAIEKSRMAITIFSKNYASSTFCLKELVKILQFIKGDGRLVWPIFYDVEPSDVRHQKGNYEEALAMHKKNLKADEEEMKRWKLALCEVANFSGSHFSSRHGQYEYQFIETIVNEISSKINRVPLHVAEYPVGVDSRVLKINSLLWLGSEDGVHMVGICGIGGIGKTTIARTVYNSIADNFEGLCFLYDIKENSRKHGLEQMQERMLSKIIGVDTKVVDVNEGVPIIKMRLKQKKILLILDNVDKKEQLEKLAGWDWFGCGSRIIITTRDKQLLERHGIVRIYDMETFNLKESLELLTWNAFRNNEVDSAYMKVLNHVVSYVQGLPLALEVIGSHLFGMSVSEWESAINIYRQIPNKDIQRILKVSYDDGLEDYEKEIFLDIACFYKGSELEYVKKMVEHTYGLDLACSIRVLISKCLIKIDVYNRIEMHDLIQDMGREIVRQESPREPGKRTRLWFHEDITHVLEENAGTDKINIIIQDYWFKYMEVKWDGEAFKNMKNLKILSFEKARFSEGPKYLPDSLKVLKWPGYPSSLLPCDPRNLLVFELPHSCLNSLEPIKKSKDLSVLNLPSCQYIKQIPDLRGIPGLKRLWLDECENLIEIDDSVGYLPKLETLSVYGCAKLRTFPRRIKLPSLKLLSLQGCSSLKYFPEILEKMEYLTGLYLERTGIEKLPSSISNLTELSELYIGHHETKIKLPSSIAMLPKLEMIEARRCRKFIVSNSKLKEGQGVAFSLIECNISNEILVMFLTSFTIVKYLDLTANNFTILPACIKECRFLLELKLNYCMRLRDVRGIPPNIQRLEAESCISLSSESKNFILSQESLGVAIRNCGDIDRVSFYMPGAKIPEWFDHRSRGPIISFWFRNKLPTVAVCVVIPTKDERRMANTYHPADFSYFRSDYYSSRTAVVFINGKIINKHIKAFYTYAPDDDYILVYGLKRDHFQDYKMKKAFREREWNYVEVGIDLSLSHKMFVRESGIYVIKQDCSMEDVRFTNPYERLGDNLMLYSLSCDQGAISNKAIISPFAEADGEPFVSNMKDKEPMLNKKGKLKELFVTNMKEKGPMLDKKRKLKEHALRFPYRCSTSDVSWAMLEFAVKIMKLISSRDILKSHHLRIEIDCPFCGKTQESLNHIFIHCDFARSVWFASPLGLRIDEVQPQDICSWLRLCICKNLTPPLLDAFFKKAVIITLHCIWEARNSLIYENLQPSPVATIHKIRAYLQSPPALLDHIL